MRIVAPRNLFIEFMVMVYCFIWLNRQAEAPQKATVNRLLVNIRANEWTRCEARPDSPLRGRSKSLKFIKDFKRARLNAGV